MYDKYKSYYHITNFNNFLICNHSQSPSRNSAICPVTPVVAPVLYIYIYIYICNKCLIYSISILLLFDRPKKFLSVDIRTRHTIWNMGLGIVTAAISVYGTEQFAVMRALSLSPSHRRKYVPV